MNVDSEELEDKLKTAFNIVAKAVGIIVLPCVAIVAILFCVSVVCMAFK